MEIDHGPAFAYDAMMKLAIRLALLAGLLLELANFYLAMPPFDVGLPADASFVERLLAFQWGALHFPGLLLLDPMERAGFSTMTMRIVLFASGYFETALLIFAALLGVQRLRQWNKRPSS